MGEHKTTTSRARIINIMSDHRRRRHNMTIFVVAFLCHGGAKCDYGAPSGPSTPGPTGPTPIAAPPPPPPTPAAAPPTSAEPEPEPTTGTNATDAEPTTPTGNYTNDVTGQWYIVMSGGCEDGGIVENMMPCSCLSAYFRLLQPNNWQLYISGSDNQSQVVTVGMGGVASLEDEGADFTGFILSGTDIQPDVISGETNYTITEMVKGCSMYSEFKMTIIGYSAEDFYMITSFTDVQVNSNSTLVWCRKKSPGKKTIWTKVLQNLYSLDINPHTLTFINQQGCKRPTLNQFDEMFFCS